MVNSTPQNNGSNWGDSIQRPTILGIKLTNPYTLDLMAQAYANLGITNVSVVPTHTYVRFLPSDFSQFSSLVDYMETQNLEVEETPTEYNTDVEGDYYQDPGFTSEQIPWLYSTVPVGFTFPAGISYQVIAQIHIPGDNFTAVETEAERLASNIDNGGGTSPASVSKGVVPNVTYCLQGYYYNTTQHTCVPIPFCGNGSHFDVTLQKCVVDACPSGYHRDPVTQQCIVNTVAPPAPAVDAAVPAGNVYVTETQLASNPGVRNVKVIAKRWFKREVTYTDNNGHFQFTKRFKNKVKIKVQFTNAYAKIRHLRGARFWESIWATKANFGIFSDNKSAMTLTFLQFLNGANFAKSLGDVYWAAATFMNGVQEHAEYAAQLGFNSAPESLNILITPWASFAGTASTPLFNKQNYSSIPNAYLQTFGVGSLHLALNYLAEIGTVLLAKKVDMFIDYNFPLYSFKSDVLKETVYHELSHASHYSKLPVWYAQFVAAELSEAISWNGSIKYSPYGQGNNQYSPIIALGEAWGYHMGHYLANLRYGPLASCTRENQYAYCPNGISFPHIDVLENWNPNYNNGDFFRWIPKGLMEDMMDGGIEPQASGVVDNVSGFTIQELFNGLQSDVISPQNYRDRLIQQNLNNQSTQISQLFSQYNYN